MDITVPKLVDGMQSTLEGEGFELYSKTPREKCTVLVMFNPEQRKFIFTVFDHENVGALERIDAYVDIAVDKAEAFRSRRAEQTDGSI